MLRMANAASQQAVEVGKDRLRDFLDTPAPAGARPRRQAIPISVPAGSTHDINEEIEMDSLGASRDGKVAAET